MNSTADDLKAEIASLDGQIAANDKAIEAGEGRQSLRRRHGDDLYRRLLKAQALLQREEAKLVRNRGACVTLKDANGVEWKI